MAIPTYTRIDNTEVDAESIFTESLMTRFKNNVLALLGVDEAATNPAVSLGFRGEIFATRASVIAVGITVSGSAPGPYTVVVPTGVAVMWFEGCGGGGAAGGAPSPTAGGATTVSGSTSGTLVTANGGGVGATNTAGAAGAASGRCFAGGAGFWNGGANPPPGSSAGPFGAGANGGRGGFAGHALGPGDSTGFGNGGATASGVTNQGSGGGAAGGSFLISVVPGETLTLTVGAAGTPPSAGFNPSPGFIRLRF